MKRSLLFSLVIASLYHFSQAGNILFISPLPSPSHHIFNRVFAVGLAEKGHNVTFLSADLSKDQVKNLHYIILDGIYQAMDQALPVEQVMDETDQLPVMAIKSLFEACEGLSVGALNSSGLKTLLNYPKDFKFDAVILDFTAGPALAPLVTRFNNPPLISLTAFVNPPYTTDFVGGHKYPAYIPHYNLNYGTKMNLFQRIYSTFLYVADWILREYYIFVKLEPIVRERFNFDFPSLKELSQRTVILFVNTDSAIDYPEPLPPNVIPVGGLQIVDPKPLPEMMEKFISSGKKGTVLMSLGTNIKSSIMGKQRLAMILETFKAFPDYNFLWKFEADVADLPINLSKNVMLGKFLPQNDILSHPNIKAFITHSGMLSTHESFWHGKPIIAIPFFADQHSNAQKAINLGICVKVDFKTISVDSLKSAIYEVLSNPEYSKNAAKISTLFQDKPQKPLTTAIWWVEYVMRNDNFDHIKSPTVGLGFLASNSYDVLIFIALAIIITICVIKRIFRNLFKTKTMKIKAE